jgi:hypothetical protein
MYPLSVRCDELITDRPDFTESTEVVGANILQVETGFRWDSERCSGAGNRTFTAVSPLVRLGVSRHVELRAGNQGYLRRVVPGLGRQAGLSDTSFGAKVKLRDERAVVPALSVISSVSIPSGNRQFSSGSFDPALTLAWSRGLPRGFDLAGNLNFVATRAAGGRSVQRAYSFATGRRLSRSARAYWEAYWIGPAGASGGLWTFNTGLTRQVGRDAQLDVEVGRSLRGLPCWFAGVGFSFRAPFGRFAR